MCTLGPVCTTTHASHNLQPTSTGHSGKLAERMKDVKDKRMCWQGFKRVDKHAGASKAYINGCACWSNACIGDWMCG